MYNRTYASPYTQGYENAGEEFFEVIDKDENPIRNRYMQGDIEGGNLKFLFGNIFPNYEANDPEDN